MQQSRMKNKCFTLIELMVVLAIIAILLSLLIPSLGRSRTTARTTLSKNNLKQIFIATLSYSESNDGYLPLPAENPHPASNDDGANWTRIVYEHINGPFSLDRSTCKEQMADSGGYNGMMFCPIIRANRGPISQHAEGRSDYSMNWYFQQQTRKFSIVSGLGDSEPFMMPGTGMNSSQGASRLKNTIYSPSNDNGHPAYVYQNKSFASFMDGRITPMTKAKGSFLDADVNNKNDFK